MQLAKKYTLPMRIMHWLLATLLLGMIGMGAYMSSLSGENPLRKELYHLHKSFGILVLALVVVRVAIRFCSKIPRLPEGISRFEEIASAIAIFSLYVLMFSVPVSGYIFCAAGGYNVPFFTYHLPNIFAQQDLELSKIAHFSHQLFAYSLLGIACLHMSAPFKHLVLDKVNIFKRIV